MRSSLETLYQWIYADAKEGGTFYQFLLKQRHRRKPRRGTGKRLIILNRVGIEQRPLEVQQIEVGTDTGKVIR